MSNTLTHDSFCRDVLSYVPTFLEFINYLSAKNADLGTIINFLDMDTLIRIPGDFSDTASTGYADLAFRADVKKELLKEIKPVQVCVGFLLEHKSARDDKVLEQLRRYHFHMMVEKCKENALRGIPSVAIILYNGTEKWNPLNKLERLPEPIRNLMLPFKCIFVDVDKIDDATCLNQFSSRLGAFIITMKYARDPEAHKDVFRRVLARIGTPALADGTLDLLASIDVYLHQWLSQNFKEIFNMDFVKPPYKTIADAEREEREALEKQRDSLEKKLADSNEALAAERKALAAKDAENENLAAENAALKAKLAALSAK